MKTKVYDKASWHIDAGESASNVLAHFEFVMNWCNQNNLLTAEGEEILSLGVDASISIHSRLFNERGNMFMTKFYDMFISAQSDQFSKMSEKLNTI